MGCGNKDDNRFKGVCDKNGCDVQTFRLGNKEFYGKGGTVDTSQKITVVTQFITEDGTDTGTLKEIRRHYVQNGKKIETPDLSVGFFNSISTAFCEAEVGLKLLASLCVDSWQWRAAPTERERLQTLSSKRCIRGESIHTLSRASDCVPSMCE